MSVVAAFRKRYVKYGTLLRNVLPKPFPLSELKLPRNSRLLAIGPVSTSMQEDIQKQKGFMGIKASDMRGAVLKYLDYIRDRPDIEGINLIQINITKPLHHRRWTLIKNDSYALPVVCKRDGYCHHATRQLYEFCKATHADAAKVILPVERVERTFYSITDGERVVIIPATVKNHSAIDSYRVLYAALFEGK